MRLLLADDEIDLANAISEILRFSGYEVVTAHDGADALGYATSENFDCIILDIMMPKISGLEVLSRMRSEGVHTPVILLTAKSELEDRLQGLDTGADDYITKPFETPELLARIRALLRRQHDYAPDVLQFGGLTLNLASFELGFGGKTLALANKELQLMEKFMRQPNRVLSSLYLMNEVWGLDSESEINVVWVHISHLRNKLRQLGANCEIKAKRSAGFYLVSTETEAK